MNIIHLVPGHSAAGSLKLALREAGRADEVLVFGDDLSCGPIGSDVSGLREHWWTEEVGWPAKEGEDIERFWDRARKLEGRIVVWFSAHAAQELAFRLAWAWHMRDAAYHLIDITGRQVSYRKADGTDMLEGPFIALGSVPDNVLSALLDSERPAMADEEVFARDGWERLMAENAPFRVVTPQGLASAPIDHFDSLLLKYAEPEWTSVARVIGHAMADDRERYAQVGDWMLYTRIVALVDAGRLIADGDVREGYRRRIKLPVG